MYRCFYNPVTLQVQCYEDESTSPIKPNSFSIDEIPEGEGIPYVDTENQSIYFLVPDPTPEPASASEPSIENYLLNIDYRLSLIELGVN